jgi:flagellin
MVMTATTNVSANTALRYLSQNSAAASSSLAKLSSGSRIVKASDDAASLAVGTRIKADVTALKQAASNTAQGQSLL